MMENKIVKSNSQLAQTWSDADDVRSLARRIKVMVPGGKNLQDGEAEALAQISLITGCNPFIGEVWYIPGKGPMIGIKGLRRHGDEQIQDAGGKDAYYQIRFDVISPEDAGAPAELLDVVAAYRAVLTDSVSLGKFQKLFIETVNAFRAANDPDPVGTARELLGKRPEWIGYGYATKSEQTKMNKQMAARKRAEADALKQRFYIPFGAQVAAADLASESDDAAPEWLDGAISETTNGVEISQGETQAETDLQNATRPYSPDQLKQRIQLFANEFQRKEKLSANVKQRGLVASMIELCFAGQADSKEIRHAVMKYLTGYKSTAINDGAPGIYILALLQWLKPAQDNGGAYAPDAVAVQEAIKVHKAIQVAAGQLEMKGIE